MSNLVTRLGIWLAILGVLALVLPHFGWDLRWFKSLGDARPYVAGGCIVLGAAVAVWDVRRRSRASS